MKRFALLLTMLAVTACGSSSGQETASRQPVVVETVASAQPSVLTEGGLAYLPVQTIRVTAPRDSDVSIEALSFIETDVSGQPGGGLAKQVRFSPIDEVVDKWAVYTSQSPVTGEFDLLFGDVLQIAAGHSKTFNVRVATNRQSGTVCLTLSAVKIMSAAGEQLSVQLESTAGSFTGCYSQ